MSSAQGLVGREAELALALAVAAVRQLSEGQASALVIEGEAGHAPHPSGHPHDRRHASDRAAVRPGAGSVAPPRSRRRAAAPLADAANSLPAHGDLAEIRLGPRPAYVVCHPALARRRLRAVERYASPEALEEAEIEATLAAHDEWVAAGCPGARSHEDVMAELLGSDQ